MTALLILCVVFCCVVLNDGWCLYCSSSSSSKYCSSLE